MRADKAYYRTHRGDVVGADHPDRHTLVCKAGETISRELASELGLVQAPALVVEAEATVQAVEGPQAVQAVAPPTRAKAKAKAKAKRNT